ncbi:hypothetical protein GH714_036187 [Hevea brasiliensis]|uniref:Uncharacterized protein n=1 Tax=Hevea brasiliensis TaxID=3981 RepID=A0A6A6KKV2_HEVBR|nr:hypothetical protein GH714_036187 [Hevea brasiliensis]
MHYVDEVNRFEEASQDPKANAMIAKVSKNEILDDCLSDLGKETKQGKEEESDTETIKDSVSSQGDSLTADDEKVERVSRVPKSFSNKNSIESSRGSRDMKVSTKPSSDSSEGASDDKPVEDVKEIDVLDEASNSTQSIESENETVDAEENGDHEDEAALNQRIEEME